MELPSREDNDSGTSVEVDLDYGIFTKSLDISDDEEEVTGHTGSVDINGDNIHQDGRFVVKDAEYKMFLANLKKDGDSYAVQITLDDGVSMPVKYEIEGPSNFGYIGRSSNFRHIGTDLPVETWQRKFKSAETEKNTDSQKRATGNQKIEKPISNMSGAENIRNQKRKSPTVENKDEVNHTDLISNRTNKDMSKKPKLKHHFNELVCIDFEDDADWAAYLKEIPEMGQEVMFSKAGKSSPDLKIGKKDVDETGQPVTFNKVGQNTPDRRIGEKDVDKTGQLVMYKKAEKNSPVRNIGKKYVDKMGQQVMVKKARLNSPDRKIDEKDESPPIELTFREKLMNVLRKPHDDEECDDLWKRVCIRKPMERHRESRSGRIKPVILNSPGRSHLDNDKRLAMEVKKVQDDRRKLLYILRGYFFWLEFSPMEGAFAPWCDKECLKMMPS